MNYAVARELKAARIRQDMSLEEVAKLNNVSYETMRRYEKGETNITIEFLEKMLSLYNTDISIFFKNVCENMHENLKEN